MQEHLKFCLTQPTDIRCPADAESWSDQWRRLAAQHPDPVALALRGGFAADRVGWAFAAGYQGAMRRLLAGLGQSCADGALLALCATEENGNRPRDITTTLSADGQGWRLDGKKSWVTLGRMCDELLVVARSEQSGERPLLKVARVPAAAAGVHVHAKPPLDFVPEITHSAATFEAVALPGEAVLGGDGYDDVVKPFRTVEDIFIALAVQSWLLREARARRWPAAFSEALAASLVTLAALADWRADDALTHVAVAGALARTHGLYEEADRLWEGEDDEAAQRWRHDRALFQVAGKARSLRAQRAWERL